MAVNGDLPLSSLVRVQPGLYLTPLAAASWARIVAGVQRRFGWTPRLTDAYRIYAEQVRIFLERYEERASGTGVYGDVRWWAGRRFVRKPGTAAAAVPGTSNHGNATAVDVADLGGFNSTRYAQFAMVAAEEGWSNAEGRSVNEPWHWTKNSASYINNPIQNPGNVPVIPDIKPIAPITPEEITMEFKDMFRLIRRTGDGAVLAKDVTSGDVRLVTFAAYQTLEAMGLVPDMWVENARGNPMNDMDPAPFLEMARFLGYTGPI